MQVLGKQEGVRNIETLPRLWIKEGRTYARNGAGYESPSRRRIERRTRQMMKNVSHQAMENVTD
jgi:hypothetical protein